MKTATNNLHRVPALTTLGGSEAVRTLQERGLIPERYPGNQIVGTGGYSMALAHEDPRMVVKATVCEATIRFWPRVRAAALPGFVRVYESCQLGVLPGPPRPVTAFLLERLEPAAPRALKRFVDATQVAVADAEASGGRPPPRGQAGYADFFTRVCSAMSGYDPERSAEWQFLASYLRECTNDYQSVDLLTEGNVLSRDGFLGISDPVRIAPGPQA